MSKFVKKLRKFYFWLHSEIKSLPMFSIAYMNEQTIDAVFLRRIENDTNIVQCY